MFTIPDYERYGLWGVWNRPILFFFLLQSFQVTKWGTERKFLKRSPRRIRLFLTDPAGERLTWSGSITCGSGSVAASYNNTAVPHTLCKKWIWCVNTLPLVAVPSFTLFLFSLQVDLQKAVSCLILIPGHLNDGMHFNCRAYQGGCSEKLYNIICSKQYWCSLNRRVYSF